MLINTTTLQQITEQQFRELKPNVSYPAILSADTLAAEGYAVVFPAPAPVYDPITQAVREVTPELTVKGHWEQRYETFALDAEQIAANAEAKRVASIPVSVTPRQIRHALNAAGLRTQVEEAVAAGGQDLKDWWEFSSPFERNHSTVNDLGAALGKTPEEIDAVFILAASL